MFLCFRLGHKDIDPLARWNKELLLDRSLRDWPSGWMQSSVLRLPRTQEGTSKRCDNNGDQNE